MEILNNKYIESTYNFKGIWDIPSLCGIKIVKQSDETVVILSELYHDNPGTSITEACDLVANQVCEDYGINKSNVRFIHHIPDIGSKYEFYKEDFDEITFEMHNNKLKNPSWLKIKKEEVDQLLTI